MPKFRFNFNLPNRKRYGAKLVVVIENQTHPCLFTVTTSQERSSMQANLFIQEECSWFNYLRLLNDYLVKLIKHLFTCGNSMLETLAKGKYKVHNDKSERSYLSTRGTDDNQRKTQCKKNQCKSMDHSPSLQMLEC